MPAMIFHHAPVFLAHFPSMRSRELIRMDAESGDGRMGGSHERAAGVDSPPPEVSVAHEAIGVRKPAKPIERGTAK